MQTYVLTMCRHVRLEPPSKRNGAEQRAAADTGLLAACMCRGCPVPMLCVDIVIRHGDWKEKGDFGKLMIMIL